MKFVHMAMATPISRNPKTRDRAMAVDDDEEEDACYDYEEDEEELS